MIKNWTIVKNIEYKINYSAYDNVSGNYKWKNINDKRKGVYLEHIHDNNVKILFPMEKGHLDLKNTFKQINLIDNSISDKNLDTLANKKRNSIGNYNIIRRNL